MKTLLLLLIMINGNIEKAYKPLDMSVEDCLIVAEHYQKQEGIDSAFCIEWNGKTMGEIATNE